MGVFAGSLSHFLCTCRPDMAFYMVDNWLAGEDQPDHYKATNDYSTRIDKTEAERLKGLAVTVAKHHVGAIIKEGDSWDVGMRMLPNSLDLVFLDADHSYEGVKRDLQAWRATVKSGGWISGHDYGNGS